MTTLTLNAGTSDLVLDASLSSIDIKGGSLCTIEGAIKMSSFTSGVASFDASGNLSSVAGSVFNVGSNYSLSGTWAFSNTVTHSAAIMYTGAATQSASLGVPTTVVPAGWSHVIMNNTTGELRRMT